MRIVYSDEEKWIKDLIRDTAKANHMTAGKYIKQMFLNSVDAAEIERYINGDYTRPRQTKTYVFDKSEVKPPKPNKRKYRRKYDELERDFNKARHENAMLRAEVKHLQDWREAVFDARRNSYKYRINNEPEKQEE